MFSIIGGDGKEYGPVTAGQIRGWIAAGRANLDTKAKAAGSDEWQRLGDFPDFASPDGAPPVMTAAAGDFPRADSGRAAELASLGARIGAAVINATVYFICMMPGSLMVSREMLRQNPQLRNGGFPRFDQIDPSGLLEQMKWVWAGLLAAFAVQALLLAWRGQNIGKLLVGIRVVDATTGEPAGFVRPTILRFFFPVSLIFLLNILPPFGFLFLFVDFCFIFRTDRRCLHDLIAGTKVVKR